MAEAAKAEVVKQEPVVAPDPDAKRYEALEKELGADEGEELPGTAPKFDDDPPAKREQPRDKGRFAKAEPEPRAEPKEDEKAEPEVVDPKVAPDAPKKLTVEELERNYNNTQKALREERAARTESDGRLKAFTQLVEQLQQKRQAKEAPVEAPDINENPVGYFQHELAAANKRIEELSAGTKQTAEQLAQRDQQQQFWNRVISSETEIRKTATDYDDAVRHLEEGRVKELQLMYPDDSPQAEAIARQYGLQSVAALRSAVLDNDRISVATQALQLGIEPAQMYYDLAKQRGYVKAEPAPGTNGKEPPKQDAKAVIETVRRGQKAAKSISGGEGGQADNPMSLVDLADLYDEDPAEFDKVWDQMKKAGQLG